MRTLFAWISILIALVVAMWHMTGLAYGSGPEVVEGLYKLAPDLDPARASVIAFETHKAALETKISPFLILAIIKRESDFAWDIEALKRFGRLGERGLMQVHGVALDYRPSDCSSKLAGPRCQIRTGARFLAAVRDHCGGSKSRWVASYGMSRCASEKQARRSIQVLQAKQYYRAMTSRPW